MTASTEDSITASHEDNVIPSPEESNTTAPEDSNTALSEDSTTASLERFTDYDDIAPWAVENLARALAAGLITGYADGSLQPGGGITRAEAAALLLRLWNNR